MIRLDNADIATAIDCMRKGGVILYPTDTIWGLGCDATNRDAVRRIFEIKQRADSKALITLVGNEAALERIVDEVPDVAWQLIEVSNRPTTIVYDHGRSVAPELLADDGSIGVRLTREPFSAELCKRFRRPVVSTSANISGNPSPATFAEIDPDIISKVDYVCTSRRDEEANATPSMVIKISSDGVFKILRG